MKILPTAGAKLAKKRKRNFIKVGNVKIPWYRLGDGRTEVDPQRYGRKRRTFVDHDEAIREATRQALEVSQGGEEALSLTAADRAAFAHATAEARKHGVDLVTAISEWSAVRAILEGGDLLDIAKAGVAAKRVKEHRVIDVVLELLASKETQDLNARYFRGLRSALQAFAAAVPAPLERITSVEIQTYVDGLDVGPRRRNNVLKEIRHLFRFAKMRGYLSDRATEAGKVEIIKRVKSHIGVLTPAAMQLHLDHVDGHFLPWLLINAFSGVRTEEIVLTKDAARRKDALRWEDFDWESREICVREETAKTFTARRCPILDNLYAWLQPWRDDKATGPVCPRIKERLPRPDHERVRFLRGANQAMALDLGRPKVDLSFPHNAYRHSYGSYRMAVLKDMQKLSYEMGNSVGMIKRNYNNPRPIAEAQQWFAIFPAALGNVVQLPLAL